MLDEGLEVPAPFQQSEDKDPVKAGRCKLSGRTLPESGMWPRSAVPVQSMVCCARSRELPTRVPQAVPFALLPLVEAVQGIGSAGFGMLAAATGWDAEDTARQHQEFLPGLLVVVVHDGSKGLVPGSGSTSGGHCAAHGGELAWRLAEFPGKWVADGGPE